MSGSTVTAFRDETPEVKVARCVVRRVVLDEADGTGLKGAPPFPTPWNAPKSQPLDGMKSGGVKLFSRNAAVVGDSFFSSTSLVSCFGALPGDALALVFNFLTFEELSRSTAPVCVRWYTIYRQHPLLHDARLMYGLHLFGGVSRCFSPMLLQKTSAAPMHYSPLPSEAEWRQTLPPGLEERYHNAVAVLQRKIFVIGGRNTKDRLSSCEFLDPAVKNWQSLPSMPCARSAPAVVVYGNKLYVFGGFDGRQDVAAVAVFDPATWQWTETTVAPMPAPCCEAAAVTAGDKIYVVGGRKQGQAAAMVEVRCLDPKTNTWTLLPPLTRGRMGPVAAVVAGALHVVGGSDGRTATNAMEVMDLEGPEAHARWREGPPMVLPRCNPAGAVIGGRLCVLGGFYTGQGGPMDTVEVYLPGRGVWVQGPRMSKKCDAGKAVVWE